MKIWRHVLSDSHHWTPTRLRNALVHLLPCAVSGGARSKYDPTAMPTNMAATATAETNVVLGRSSGMVRSNPRADCIPNGVRPCPCRCRPPRIAGLMPACVASAPNPTNLLRRVRALPDQPPGVFRREWTEILLRLKREPFTRLCGGVLALRCRSDTSEIPSFCHMKSTRRNPS